jgi:glycosyltransferase involved in cell wall biosynthesis
MATLLVIIPDYVSAIIEKGEYQPRYYNPENFFDEVHLLLTNADRPNLTALQYTVGQAKLYVHNMPEPSDLVQKWRTKGVVWLREWARPAVDLARRIQPALIRCHGADLNAWAAFQIKRELGIPYVVSLHINPDVNPTRRFLESDLTQEQRHNNELFEFVERKSLRAADLVMPVYRPILPYLARMGVDRVEVCYNVLNGDDLRRKASYDIRERPRIISVGRHFSLKNPENIISAVASIPDVELTLVGNGPLQGTLCEIATQSGAGDRILFRPSIVNSELCRSLSNYDIFAVHTEHWEISKSLLEALLAGLPCVINRRNGEPVPELEGDFVLKVENTIAAYRTAFCELIANRLRREQLGKAALAQAQARWAPAKTEARFVEIYNQVIRDARDPRTKIGSVSEIFSRLRRIVLGREDGYAAVDKSTE